MDLLKQSKDPGLLRFINSGREDDELANGDASTVIFPEH
jgi:hypothetical protein